MHYPIQLQEIIEVLKKLPGVGSKSAERYAFHLLNWPVDLLKKFGHLLATIPEHLKTCLECGCLKGEENCYFCQENRQKTKSLCVVAYQKEVYAIEATQEFKGLYHVLGGIISPIEGEGPEQLNFPKLFERVKKYSIQEVVIALDSSLEGDATALFLKQELEPYPIQISRLAFGIPVGSSLDYVDGNSLARALLSRSKF